MPPLRAGVFASGTMLLRTAWRRAAAAVRVAPGPRSEAPARGLRLRGTLRAPLTATLPTSADLPPWLGDAPENYRVSLRVRCPDPLTLPPVCTPQTFSGRPSVWLTSRHPSDPASQALGGLEGPVGLQSSPARLLEMVVTQPVIFEGDLSYSVSTSLLNGFALLEPFPLPTWQFEY